MRLALTKLQTRYLTSIKNTKKPDHILDTMARPEVTLYGCRVIKRKNKELDILDCDTEGHYATEEHYAARRVG